MPGDARGSGAVLNPPGPLSVEQARAVGGLLSDLSPEQALWLSGYLAALAGPGAGELGAGGAGAATLPAGSGDGEAPLLTVLFGTETGNARGVAELLVRRAIEEGARARAVDMADYPLRKLAAETHLALVSATHGEGDPPEPAAGFFEFLMSRKAPRLEGTVYAVLGLGDSSYVEYCKAARDLDERLEALGAERLVARVECDVDYHADAEAWVERVSAAMVGAAVAAAAPVTGVGTAAGRGALPRIVLGTGPEGPAAGGSDPRVPRGADAPGTSPRIPCTAEILDSIPLTGLRSDKETRHLELSLAGDGPQFEPGDSLGVLAENEDAVIEAVLRSLGASPDAPVRIGDETRPLARALRRDLELTVLTPGFLAAYAEVAAAGELRGLLAPDRRDDLHRFVKCHQVPDVLERFACPGLEPQAFVEMTRRLQPRLYSIASSPKWVPGQVDLTVAVVRRTPDGKPRNGVASTYLTERLKPGETVSVYVDHNPAFRLPDDPGAPVIMIGAGTGVAPFRAFLQDREESGARGPSWLFFGERSFREDFLYQSEWQRLLRDGLLTRMDVAFSRDQSEKVYVQHRLRERGGELWRWLEDGAVVYVCGDAEGMAPGVHRALLDVIREEGGRSAERAEAELDRLRADRRYQRDVY